MQVHGDWPIVDPKARASFSLTDEILLFKRPYLPLKKDCRDRALDLERNDNKVD
jgi:hypothetical protein